MKYITLFLLLTISGTSFAKGCPKFTNKQESLIHQAYYTGLPEDMGLTLAGIIQQESFVGSHIVRVNPADGNGGSWGVTQIQLETAMWITGEDNMWRAKAKLVPVLLNHDAVALSMALEKLKSVKLTLGTRFTWKRLWAGYNGSGKAAEKYAGKIQDKVKLLQKCFVFK